MNAYDQWRQSQHEDLSLTSDHQLAAFLACCDPRTVALDRIAHASNLEHGMLHRLRP